MATPETARKCELQTDLLADTDLFQLWEEVVITQAFLVPVATQTELIIRWMRPAAFLAQAIRI